MARKTFNPGDTGAFVRAVIDDNFTELYDDYLPLAGGELTGQLYVKTATQYKESPLISAGTLTLNLTSSSFFNVSVNSIINNVVLQNIPPGPKVYSFIMQFTYTSNTLFTVTWPVSFKWAGGVAPGLTCVNGKTDTFNFLTHDGGTNWFAYIAELNQ